MAYEKIEATKDDIMEAEWYLLGLKLGYTAGPPTKKTQGILETAFLMKDGELTAQGHDEADGCIRALAAKFKIATALSVITSPTSSDEDVLRSLETVTNILRSAKGDGVKRSDPIRDSDSSGDANRAYVNQDADAGLRSLGVLASIMTTAKERAN